MESNLIIQDRLPIDCIAEEYPYGFRFDYQDLTLEAALEKRGILSPLLLVPRNERKAVVVSGHKRLFYALKRNWKSLPAYFVQEEFSKKELFFLSLYSNWNQNFSDLDRMEALRKGVKIFSLSPEEILTEMMPAIGMPASLGILQEYREVGELRAELHTLIHQKKLPFRGASSLRCFSKEEQLLLTRGVFDAVHLTTNQLIQIVEWLFDLKKVSRTSLDRLIQKASIQRTLSNVRLDPRARGEKLLAAIRSLRFPKLLEEEKNFIRLKHQFGEMKNILLERPEGSETPGLVLHARLKSREGLHRVLRFLETHRSSLEFFL